MVVVSELTAEHGEARSYLVEDCKNLLLQAQRSSVSHAFREANGGVDCLANYGRTAKEIEIAPPRFALCDSYESHSVNTDSTRIYPIWIRVHIRDGSDSSCDESRDESGAPLFFC